MNALTLPIAVSSPPLSLAPALRRFRAAVRGRITRAQCDDERQARRRAVLAIIHRAEASATVNTIATFEQILNESLDIGYRAQPLAAFVFDALQRRFAGRVRRRLSSANHNPDCEEVSDLVAMTVMAVQKLIRGAQRERHTLRYALLLSIADHRTIDFLRRRRPLYRGSMDDQAATGGAWPKATDGGDPEQRLYRAERTLLALKLRDAVLDAVNALPLMERAALILVEVEGLGYPAVAEQLNLKRTDVGNLVRRARLRRDRSLVPLLRATAGLDKSIGFSDLQENRALRTSMLRWSADMGIGLQPASVANDWRLIPRSA